MADLGCEQGPSALGLVMDQRDALRVEVDRLRRENERLEAANSHMAIALNSLRRCGRIGVGDDGSILAPLPPLRSRLAYYAAPRSEVALGVKAALREAWPRVRFDDAALAALDPGEQTHG